RTRNLATVQQENPLTEGLERTPVHPTTLIMFGATGDLAQRKLMPAVYNLAHEGDLPERFNLIGIARTDQPDDDYRDFAREAIKKYSRRQPDETVQNTLVLRFGNGIFEPLWNRSYIDNVQITAAEDIGIGTRAEYYDRSGALRDIVQNHLLQLLTILSMEPPVSFSADEVRNEKVKILHAIRPPAIEAVPERVVRAQYGHGMAEGHEVSGYLE